MISRCCCPQRITTSLKHLHFTAKLLWRFTSGPKRLRYVLLWLIYRKSFIQMSKFRHLLLKISYRSSKSNFTTRTRTKLHREGLTTLPWIWIRDLKLWPLWEQTPLTKTFPCKKFVKYLPNGDELAAFVYGVSDYGHWGILYVVPFLAVSHWKGKQFSAWVRQSAGGLQRTRNSRRSSADERSQRKLASRQRRNKVKIL